MNFALFLGCNSFVFVFFLWVLFVADPDSKGVGGFLSRFFTERVPQGLSRALRATLGNRVHGCVAGCIDFAFNKPNCLLQVLYLVLVNGSFLVFLLDGYSSIPNVYLANWHRISVFLAMALCMLTFSAACHTPPGVIREETVSLYDNYPSDGVIFPARPRLCRTCGTKKVARSKHCRICGHCVSRFDHHCAWLNQCVGEENYRYFLMFVLSNIGLLSYGTFLCFSILRAEVTDRGLWHAKFYARDGSFQHATLWVIIQYMLQRRGRLMGVLALASLMSLMLTGFAIYHLSLVARGMTTNEASKWQAARAYHKKLLEAWKAEADTRGNTPASQMEGNRDSPSTTTSDVQTSQSSAASLPVHPGHMPRNIYNQGLISNFAEIIWPRTFRRGLHRRLVPCCDPFDCSYPDYWQEEGEEQDESDKNNNVVKEGSVLAVGKEKDS